MGAVVLWPSSAPEVTKALTPVHIDMTARVELSFTAERINALYFRKDVTQ
jgi:hypothetical protein